MAAPPPLSKRVFEKYDRDRTGSISVDEFKVLCYDQGHRLSDAQLSLALKDLDADGSGKIEYGEFAAWWRKSDRWSSLENISDEELEKLNRAVAYFAYFDSDRSGVIDREEAKGLHADLVKNQLTTHSLERFFEDLDSNQDGEISLHEYITWLRRIGSL